MLEKIELSDFMESAVLEDSFGPSANTCNGNSCNSCGGGCYGCKDVAQDLYVERRGPENTRDLKYEIRNNA
jgi:hypothetical protein